MKFSVSAKEWREADAVRSAEIERLAVKAVLSVPDSEMLAELNDEIIAYERKFGMTTEQLLDALSAGTRSETWEDCCWLMAAKRRDRIKERIRSLS